MRKRVVIMVGVILISLGIGALVQSLCGGSDNPGGGTTPTKEPTRAQPEVSIPVQEPTQEPTRPQPDPDIREPEPTQEPTRPRPNLDIPEQVLYDEGGIIIKTDGAEYTSDGTPAVHLIGENNTNHRVYIIVPEIAINRKMIFRVTAWKETAMYIRPGGRAESFLLLYDLDPSTMMLDDSVVRDIEVQFWSDDSDGKRLGNQLFEVTAEIRTASYTDTVNYERLENRIYDKDGITIDYIFHDDDGSFDILVTNQTEDCIRWGFNDFYVNGNYAECLEDRISGMIFSGCQMQCVFEAGEFLDGEISVADIKTFDFNFHAHSAELTAFIPDRNDLVHIDIR